MAQREVATLEGFQAGYVEVAGVPTWHEVRGEGPAVVLLHGGFSGAAAWSAQAPALTGAGFRVHVPERRGHAHTPDVGAPLTYGVMAEDTTAYLEVVVGGTAHLVGWSDGAVVALLVADEVELEAAEALGMLRDHLPEDPRVRASSPRRASDQAQVRADTERAIVRYQ